MFTSGDTSRRDHTGGPFAKKKEVSDANIRGASEEEKEEEKREGCMFPQVKSTYIVGGSVVAEQTLTVLQELT